MRVFLAILLLNFTFLKADEMKIFISANEVKMSAVLFDNSSSKALFDLLKNGDLILKAKDYGNFEKNAKLPKSLPRNDKPTKSKAGDLILYQGDTFVLFYDENSWSYTKLGYIEEKFIKNLKEILGSGEVLLKLSLQ